MRESTKEDRWRNAVTVIIIMDICKARTLRLKALNKHSITHIMYSEMEMLSKEEEEEEEEEGGRRRRRRKKKKKKAEEAEEEEEEEEKWPSALWRERSLSLTPRLSE